MTDDKTEYTLMGVKEFDNLDRVIVKKNGRLIETDTTTKIIIKTYLEDK